MKHDSLHICNACGVVLSLVEERPCPFLCGGTFKPVQQRSHLTLMKSEAS